jgi:putative amide transporter protein
VLQIVLLATGVVLLANGWALLSGSAPPGTTALNLALGLIDLAFAAYYLATGDAYGALKLALFGITYAWYALNLLRGLTDHRVLGWYCFVVTVVALPVAADTFRAGDGWFGAFWLLWSGLWGLFFLIMGLGVDRVSRFTGAYALAVALVTCLAPGSLIAAGAWQMDDTAPAPPAAGQPATRGS